MKNRSLDNIYKIIQDTSIGPRGQNWTVSTMNQIPEVGFLKLSQIIGKPKANPPIPAIILVSKASWYDGVKSGRYPAPVSIGGSRGKFYRTEDIRNLIASM